MKNKTKTAGITLVALVITIVVLLILAGVSLNLVLQNNGILQKAKEASNEYKKDEDNTTKALDKLGVDIDKYLGNTVVPSELEIYVLGEDKTGIPILDIVDPDTGLFIDNDVIPDASSSVIYVNMDSNTDGIYGIIKCDNEYYYITVDGTTMKTKDIKVINSIYQGNNGVVKQDAGAITNLYEAAILKEKIDPTKKYMIVFTVNDQQKTIVTDTSMVLDLNNPISLGSDEENFAILISRTQVSMFLPEETNSDTVILKSIYCIGDSDTYIRECGFEIWCNRSNQWSLVRTPNNEYVVPSEVAGHKIKIIYVDVITGYPEFKEPIEINAYDYIGTLEKVKVSTSDLDFIFNTDGLLVSLEELDLSECGDSITIPTEFIERLQNTTIYVSSAVKANYQTYDNIVAK